MPNSTIRADVADILDALAAADIPEYPGVIWPDMTYAQRLHAGAETLRWSEAKELGPELDADQLLEEIDGLNDRIEELIDSIRTSASRRFKNKLVRDQVLKPEELGM